MLAFTRREVIAFLNEHAVSYVEDSTNALDIYSRNLIRHQIIPVLMELNPRLHEAVLSTTELLRADEAYLSGLAAAFVEGQEADAVSCQALNAQPKPVASRVIRQMAGTELSARHVDNILTLCRKENPSGELSLPAVKARREYDRLVFERGIPARSFEPVTLQIGERAQLPELGLTVSARYYSAEQYASQKPEEINKSFTTYLFKTDNICGKIVIRPRKTGDKINLFGGNGSKTLKKLFIEKRIPKMRRSLIPVIADDEGPLAVYGIGQDLRALPESECAALEIIFEVTAYEK
jgi:tRNA(Ile)-lysidine synthase